MIEEFDAPRIVKVLGDMDGFARWQCVVQNYDTGGRAVEVLIQIHEEEGVMRLATRPPNSNSSWSPLIELWRS